MSGNYRRRDTRRNVNASKETDPISLLKEKYSDSLPMLVELFPGWNEEDLVSILAELNGDLQLAVNRIADGHANQWTAAGKKAPVKAEPVQRQPRSKQKPRVDIRPFEPPKETVEASLTSNSEEWIVPSSETTLDNPFRNTQVVEEISHQFIESDVKVETIVCERGDEVSVSVIKTSVEIAESVLTSTTEEDEDFVVRLPVMPSRSHPAFEIEQPAVLLPFSAPIKSGSNIAFGAVGGKIVFGQSKSPSPVSQKTYSPEELFASAHRSPQASTSQPPYTTTSIDATSGSPPGLVTPKNAIYQQPNRDDEAPDAANTSSRRNNHPGSYYNQRQQFDVYSPVAQQRYDPNTFSQRYNPYGGNVQPTGEENYSGPSYYNTSRSGQTTYYHPPQHYPSHQMMYGSDPYASNAFTAPPARYQAGSTNFSSNNPQPPYSNFGAGHAQQPYHSPGGSNRRMF